jgi:hypothetical protein
VKVNIVFINGDLEAVQNRIQTYFILNRCIGLFLEIIQQSFLVMIMKSINNFIGEPHKPIDIVDRAPDIFVQELDCTAERSAVSSSGDFTALMRNVMEQLNHASRSLFEDNFFK